MEQPFKINADTKGNFTKEPQRTSIFLLSVKEIKERFREDYDKQIQEHHKKNKH